MHTYQIGEQTYTQEKLVLGQIEHLVKRLQKSGSFEATVPGVLKLVAERFDLLACVLLPPGVKRADLVKKLDAGETAELEDYLRGNLEWELMVQVVTDFFDCNPMSSVLKAVNSVRGKLENLITEAPLLQVERNSSKPSTASSPVGA